MFLVIGNTLVSFNAFLCLGFFNNSAYTPIHHVKFSATSGNQLEDNDIQGANGSS